MEEHAATYTASNISIIEQKIKLALANANIEEVNLEIKIKTFFGSRVKCTRYKE